LAANAQDDQAMTDISHFIINDDHPKLAELEQVIYEGLGEVSQWCRENDATAEQTHTAVITYLSRLAEAHPDVLWPAYSKSALH
jgi:hypothetical protein